MTLRLGARNATTLRMLGGYRAVQSLGLFPSTWKLGRFNT